MKFDGRGHRLGSQPSTELWEIRSQSKYLPKFKTSSEMNLRTLGKKLDLTISKISMPMRLPPIKFETQSQTKLKPKYLNKPTSNLHQPVIRRPSPIVKKPPQKAQSPPARSAKQPIVLKPEADQPQTLAVIYESLDSRAPIPESKETVTVHSPKTEVEKKTIQIGQRSRQLERKDQRGSERNRQKISQMIEKTVLPKLNKDINQIIPLSQSIDDYNNDKFKPEELVDKATLTSGNKFWRPTEIEGDAELYDDDPLPKEYLEFSFFLSMPGCKNKFVSLEGDAPVSNITSFIQRCISATPESSKTNHSESFSFSISHDLTMTRDADLGPWNTKLLSDLGLLNSEIRVLPLEEF